jgi:hypothetical protein
MMRRVRDRRVLAATLLLLVAPAAGCDSKRSSRPAALVPWTGVTPSELRERNVAPAARCRASQLHVEGRGFLFQPAAAGGTGTVVLRNTGSRRCRLDGRPVVRFVGAPASPRQRQVALPPAAPSFPKVVPPSSTLLALAPGREATLTVDWRNWCVPGAERARKPLVPPRGVRLTLPGGGGSLVGDYNAVTPCDDPAQPSTIGVRPFQPAALARPGSWTTAPVRAKVLTLSGGAPPLRGRRGDVVRYSVELLNASRTITARFDRCPLVLELLAPAGTAEVHSLNCVAATPLRPGAAERFEMRLHVPPDAPLGPNGLFWVLDAGGTQPLEVVSRLVVEQ